MKLTPEQYNKLQARNKAARAEMNATIKSNWRAGNPPLPREWGVVKGDTAAENMTQSVTLKLDWPPSVNTYWRHPSKGNLAGRHLISEKGREYRKKVMSVCTGIPVIAGKLAVRLDCYPPDRRRRDLDNLPKSILDALQHAGLIVDDSDIYDLHIVRRDLGGYVIVTITGI